MINKIDKFLSNIESPALTYIESGGKLCIPKEYIEIKYSVSFRLFLSN